MRTLNIIGISIYLIIAVVLAARRIQLTQAFHQNKIKEENYDRLTKRNMIELIVVVVLALLYVYTPIKYLLTKKSRQNRRLFHYINLTYFVLSITYLRPNLICA
ncbi:hypothetical protein [Lactobacillus kitasatonis]|uniref:hypothetical protein n=1 Tax=Lactobacillus kitasatonis TaxID=237446 RepID=UPI001F5C80ED|nr:hypothetical protein [Lactobacillus kitasatonis]